jgi:hypothetical protein
VASRLLRTRVDDGLAQRRGDEDRVTEAQLTVAALPRGKECEQAVAAGCEMSPQVVQQRRAVVVRHEKRFGEDGIAPGLLQQPLHAAQRRHFAPPDVELHDVDPRDAVLAEIVVERDDRDVDPLLQAITAGIVASCRRRTGEQRRRVRQPTHMERHGARTVGDGHVLQSHTRFRTQPARELRERLGMRLEGVDHGGWEHVQVGGAEPSHRRAHVEDRCRLPAGKPPCQHRLPVPTVTSTCTGPRSSCPCCLFL